MRLRLLPSHVLMLLLIVVATAIPLDIATSQASAFELTPQHRITSPQEDPQSSDLAMDGRGRTYAVWTSQPEPRDGSGARVHFSRLDRHGRPTEVLDLGSARRVPAQLATDPAGTSTVVFPNRRGGRGGNPKLRAVQIDRSGERGPLLTLTPPGGSVAPFSVHAEAARDGSVFVSWSSFGVQAVRIAPNGQPGPARTVTSACVTGASYDNGADLALDDRSGEAVLAWLQCDDPSSWGYSIGFARLDPKGVPGPPRTLASERISPLPPRLAVDGNGVATVAYRAVADQPQGGHAVTRLVRVLPDGSANDPVAVFDGDYATLIDIAADDSGAAKVALAVDQPGSPLVPAIVAVSPSGDVGDLHELAPRGSRMDLATDGRSTYASWAQRRQGRGQAVLKVAKLGALGAARSVKAAGPGYAADLAASRRGPALIIAKYEERRTSLRSVVPAPAR